MENGVNKEEAERLGFKEAEVLYEEAISINGAYLGLIYPQYRNAICGEKYKPIRINGSSRKSGKDSDDKSSNCPALPLNATERILRGETIKVSNQNCEIRFN